MRLQAVITQKIQQFTILIRITGSYFKARNDTAELSNWFAGNFIKLNEEKRHLLVFGEEGTEISINVGLSVIKDCNKEKLLGIIIDRKLSFKKHLYEVCKKASQKLNALARALAHMPKEKTRIVMSF